MQPLESIDARETRSRADTAPFDDASRAARLAVAGELVAAITHDLRQPLTAIEMNVAAALRQVQANREDESAAETAVRLHGAADALRDALAEQRRMREALQVLQDLAVRREPAFASVDLARACAKSCGSCPRMRSRGTCASTSRRRWTCPA